MLKIQKVWRKQKDRHQACCIQARRLIFHARTTRRCRHCKSMVLLHHPLEVYQMFLSHSDAIFRLFLALRNIVNPFLTWPIIASCANHLLRIIPFSINVRAVAIIDNVYLRRVRLSCRHCLRVHSPTGGKAVESAFVFMHVVLHANWFYVIVEGDFSGEFYKSDIVVVSAVEKWMFFSCTLYEIHFWVFCHR